MAIVDKGTLGAALEGSVNNSTGTFTTATTTADAGDIIVLYVTHDNTSTTDNHDNSEITSITDSAGNTYTKLGENTNSPTTTALDGVTTSVWMSRVTTQLATGGTITVNYVSNRLMRVTSGRVFTVTAGSTLTQSAAAVMTQVVGANDFGSAAFSGLASKERLFYRGMGKEANTTTALTPTSGYTSLSGGRSTGSAAAITGKGEFKIGTGTGDTSNPTLAVTGDTSSVFVALEELDLNVSRAPAQKALTFAGLAPLALIALLPAAAALTFTGLAPSVVRAGGWEPDPAALVFSGPAPTLAIASTASVAVPDPAALTFTRYAPTVSIGANVSLTIPTGSLRFKGPAGPNPVFQPGPATLTLTTYLAQPTFRLATPAQAVLTLAGQAPTRLVAPKGTFLVPTGTLDLEGQYVGQGLGFLQAGSLDIAGLAPALKFGTGRVPGQKALVLTGLLPVVKQNAVLQVPAGAVTLDGQAPNALLFGVFGPPRAQLVLAGQTPQAVIGLAPSPTMTPGPAVLTITTYAPSGSPNRAIAVPAASLSLAGTLPVADIVGISTAIAVPTGSLTFTGQAPTLKYFYVVSPATARLRLRGVDPEMAGAQFGSGKQNYPGWQTVVNSSG